MINNLININYRTADFIICKLKNMYCEHLGEWNTDFSKLHYLDQKGGKYILNKNRKKKC